MPEYWHQGLAKEGSEIVIEYAAKKLGAKKLFAGPNPKNEASKKVLEKLDFKYTHDELYAPTGLMHPSYEYIFKS